MSDTLAIEHADIDSLIPKFIQTNISKIINFWTDTNFLPVTLPEKQIILFGEIIAEWRIVQPLPITIAQSDGLYIASDEIFDVYGDGDTEYEAVVDYKISLLDYYQLAESRAREDEQNQALFDHLRLYLAHVT